MERPSPDASEEELIAFVRTWMELAARVGFEPALAELDPNDEVPWTQALFEELTFDHFDDGRQPRITDPKSVAGLRVDAVRYDDGSGFSVEHDLPLDGKHSDFTATFDFRKTDGRYRVVLQDVQVL